MNKERWKRPATAELKRKLSPLAFEVTQNAATEPPFHNAYWDHHEDGIFVDSVTGEPLFSSTDKFNSNTGWPSFTRPIEPGHVVEQRDMAHGMVRVEVLSAGGLSHLGHVFEDGPAPSRLRYCINSAALRFVPKAQLAASGYGRFAALFAQSDRSSPPDTPSAVCAPPKPSAPPAGTGQAAAMGQGPGCQTTLETAVVAGGCFWGMEEIVRAIPGVLETEVGYTGGTTSHPTYEQVKTGRTGHAEALRVVFDPAKLSYADFLERWFFKMHDPTTKNRQGHDVGSQYRSAIFAMSPVQQKTAQEVIARVNASGVWKHPVVTEVVPAGEWTPAEAYHQDYLQRHPGGYTCHYLRD